MEENVLTSPFFQLSFGVYLFGVQFVSVQKTDGRNIRLSSLSFFSKGPSGSIFCNMPPRILLAYFSLVHLSFLLLHDYVSESVCLLPFSNKTVASYSVTTKVEGSVHLTL